MHAAGDAGVEIRGEPASGGRWKLEAFARNFIGRHLRPGQARKTQLRARPLGERLRTAGLCRTNLQLSSAAIWSPDDSRRNSYAD
jgi:hypothetical protein